MSQRRLRPDPRNYGRMLAITAVTIGTSSAIMVFAAGGSLSEAILIGGVGLLLGLATAWYLGRLLSTIR